MEEHEVKEIVINEKNTFKSVSVDYDASYYLCDKTNEVYVDETQNKENDIRLKDAYRIRKGLLTSKDIKEIRKQYMVSQKDLAIILGWGQKTITRYESHQVQDKAHDSILKKIGEDPEWFISLLKDSKDNFTDQVFDKYMLAAKQICVNSGEYYIRKAIEVNYVNSDNSDELKESNMISRTVELVKSYIDSIDISMRQEQI